MSWSVLIVSLALQAGEPCEAPRVRDVAPLLTATAQDKVMAQSFTKAAAACAERGAACDQARLECGGLLTATIERQKAFDDGVWLRDMLLPYLGGTYALSRTFTAAAPAPDTSCNVDVATLTVAAQRRSTQAARREALAQEYAGYGKWAQAQQLTCREQKAADDAKAVAAKAEADRVGAAAAAAAAASAATVAAAEAIKQQQAQEAAARADAEQKAKQAAEARAEQEREAKEAQLQREREAKEAQVQREREAKEALATEQQRRAEAEREARDERERDRKANEERFAQQEETRKAELAAAEAVRLKEKADAEEKARLEKAEAVRQAEEAEAKKKIEARDTYVAQQREYKVRLVKDAEEALERAKTDELVKKQAALEAVDQSPAIAQAAVTEAARAEAVRIDAEKKLFEAKQKADAIVIDDSHERSRGSAAIAGGGGANAGGFGLGVLGMLHLGFWGVAPPEGMASGFEVRLWGRYTGQVAGGGTPLVDALLTGRYYFGPFGIGLGGSLTAGGANFSSLGFGAGPAIGLTFLDTPQWRVGINGTYLVLGNTIDPTRFLADMEVSWRFLTFQIHGGSYGRVQVPDGPMQLQWAIGGFVGIRASW